MDYWSMSSEEQVWTEDGHWTFLKCKLRRIFERFVDWYRCHEILSFLRRTVAPSDNEFIRIYFIGMKLVWRIRRVFVTHIEVNAITNFANLLNICAFRFTESFPKTLGHILPSFSRKFAPFPSLTSFPGFPRNFSRFPSLPRFQGFLGIPPSYFHRKMYPAFLGILLWIWAIFIPRKPRKLGNNLPRKILGIPRKYPVLWYGCCSILLAFFQSHTWHHILTPDTFNPWK